MRVMIAVLMLLLVGGCGESGECIISGSQCDLVDCGFDKLFCLKNAAPSNRLSLYYKCALDVEMDFIAVIRIDPIGTELIEGMLFEGARFTHRVTLARLNP